MRASMLLAGIACLALITGCPAKQQAEPAKTEPVKVEPPKKEEPKAEAKKEGPKAEAKKEEPEAKKDEVKKEEPKAEAKGEPSAEENCGALYDVAKQLVEAFGKKPGGKVTKELPPRDKYIDACKQLPPEVTRCMNPQIASKEPQKCKEVMQKAMTTDRAKIEKAMKGMSVK